MEAKQAEAEERISAIREEIAFLIGDVEIGANASTSAFKSYLYKDLGLPVVKPQPSIRRPLTMKL